MYGDYGLACADGKSGRAFFELHELSGVFVVCAFGEDEDIPAFLEELLAAVESGEGIAGAVDGDKIMAADKILESAVVNKLALADYGGIGTLGAGHAAADPAGIENRYMVGADDIVGIRGEVFKAAAVHIPQELCELFRAAEEGALGFGYRLRELRKVEVGLIVFILGVVFRYGFSELAEGFGSFGKLEEVYAEMVLNGNKELHGCERIHIERKTFGELLGFPLRSAYLNEKLSELGNGIVLVDTLHFLFRGGRVFAFNRHLGEPEALDFMSGGEGELIYDIYFLGPVHGRDLICPIPDIHTDYILGKAFFLFLDCGNCEGVTAALVGNTEDAQLADARNILIELLDFLGEKLLAVAHYDGFFSAAAKDKAVILIEVAEVAGFEIAIVCEAAGVILFLEVGKHAVGREDFHLALAGFVGIYNADIHLGRMAEDSAGAADVVALACGGKGGAELREPIGKRHIDAHIQEELHGFLIAGRGAYHEAVEIAAEGLLIEEAQQPSAHLPAELPPAEAAEGKQNIHEAV